MHYPVCIVPTERGSACKRPAEYRCGQQTFCSVHIGRSALILGLPMVKLADAVTVGAS